MSDKEKKKNIHGSYFQNKKKYYDTLDQADYEATTEEKNELDKMSEDMENYGQTDYERKIFQK